jgi:hypothetical protein
MKFPGTRLLQQWDLSSRPRSLEDVFRFCREAGLTGLAELRLRDTVGLIFYYLGAEVNALYREGAVAYNGQGALDRLKARDLGRTGSIAIYEMPLDMAHLLRGITSRKKLPEQPTSGAELDDLLSRLEKAEHTGTLEVQAKAGGGMILLVRGRVSNVYWETASGLIFEKAEARSKLNSALRRSNAALYLADFSRETWKARTEVTAATRHRLDRQGPVEAEEAAPREDAALGEQVLSELALRIPLIQCFLFELTTGGVLARVGMALTDTELDSLAQRIPSVTTFLRNQTRGPGEEDGLQYVELSTSRFSVLVAIVAEALEAIAVVADRTQPIPLVGSALSQAAAEYAARLHAQRRPVPA